MVEKKQYKHSTYLNKNNQQAAIASEAQNRNNRGMKPKHIEITGARVNTLKNVSCNLPTEQLVVITGPSGSGKSSLAFDTLYAEGQRRFIESMSSYARQFMARIEKPDVDSIKHILPAIALEQKNSIKNARSTVGTATEIEDYLRVLFAALGKTICSHCGHDEVGRANPHQIEDAIGKFPDGSKLLLLASVSLQTTPLPELIAQGFFRLYHNGEIVEATALKDDFPMHQPVQVVIDRLIVRSAKQHKLGTRLLESIKNALTLGNGDIEIVELDTQNSHRFQTSYACFKCHTPHTEPFPNMFSFNSPLGACPTCEGFGRIIGLDLDKVIPNKNLSLEEAAIHPFGQPSNLALYEEMIKACKKLKIPVDVPYNQLTDAQKAMILDGDRSFTGVREYFDWLESKKYKVHVRVQLAKYRGYYPCPDCLGSRLQKQALNVFLDDKNYLDITHLSIGNLLAFITELQTTLNERQHRLTDKLFREILNRLNYLNQIGLSYLNLARQSRTLSGGESQRIHLTAALGSRLTDTMYVLDEPTVGLHARDTERLLLTLKSLRDNGNTVIVVEHDPDVMLAADHILDMGPSGGEEGGRILYEGEPDGLMDCKYSVTGQYLHNPEQPTPPDIQKITLHPSRTITISGARGNNLKNLTVKLPTHRLVCVTGVSGSGKSTLIKQTLYTAYEHQKGKSLQLDEAPHDSIDGLEDFGDVLMIDQTPPGRSARSNPATFVKAYDDIRALFADTRKAMILGIKASDFSFNSVGGRCEPCEGLGTLTIDMQFMADVTMTCPDCQGRRFNPNVLSIEIDGKGYNDETKGKAIVSRNIDAVLNMTVDEAMRFFHRSIKIRNKLLALQEIGLGYLKLGQSTATLSGGEAQRLKLAGYLKSASDKQQPMLFLFDEPTTGLHMADIKLLVQAFRKLLAVGHSIVVIEHNIDFIAQCDYLIDMGPEGGEGGGQIIAQGTVNEVMNTPNSLTGQFLAQRLGAALYDRSAV